MDIINPYYKPSEHNIFDIRKIEYDKLESDARNILLPVVKLGFNISEFGIEYARSTPGELCKTVRRNFKIVLEKAGTVIDLSMSIPKLIDDNYIIINGRRKIPQFQLFDIPVVTRGKNIKLRTNVASMVISFQKKFPYTYCSFLGKTFPFEKLLCAYYFDNDTKFSKLIDLIDLKLIQDYETSVDGLNKFEADMKLRDKTEYCGYLRLLYDLKCIIEDSSGWTKAEFVESLGNDFSQYDSKTKGEDIVYAIDLIPDADPTCAKFLRTGGILEEILEAVKEPKAFDDLDYSRNKRIRCFEYIVLSKISKVIFDFCMANRNAKVPKFNVNSTQILSECNVSDIVQFDFSINPIEELTRLSRTSLVGPGGFSRDNIPKHLRDLSPTTFGRLCPVDTPDRDNCGVLQSLLVNTPLDENLKFTEDHLKDKEIVSTPVALVPFMMNDDQTRLQMASSQMRQSIMLFDFDQPMIRSGCESLYSKYTQFIKIAKKNGEVVHLDDNYIIVAYEDNTVDLFEVGYRQIYVDNVDFIKIYVKQGDKFKAGDILAESNFMTNGSINIGRNLFTAVMSYHGFNYEDGIVISDKLVNEGSFTSVHYADLSFTLPPNKILLSLDKDKYKPLPEPVMDRDSKSDSKKKYDFVEQSTPYAILKEMPDNPLDYYSVFEEPIPLLAKKNLFITDVNIYANSWNTEIPEFNSWVKKKIDKQKGQEKKIQTLLSEYFSKDTATRYIKDKGLDKFEHTEKFKIKGDLINGIHVEILAVFTRKIAVGDKIGNRHGNKGVISKIIPHEQMPMMEDGRHVDMCLGPLGVIARMIAGQTFETHISMALNDLKKNMMDMLKKGLGQRTIKKYLYDFIKIIDNTTGGWYFKQLKENVDSITIDEKFIDELYLIQPPFESSTKEQIMRALTYTGTKTKYKIFDPLLGEWVENEIAVGFLYYFRMVHIAESKLSARSIGSFAKKTLQPLGGKKNKGGQRLGEMETACLIAHDAPIVLEESLTTKSDCIYAKNKYFRDVIDSDFMKEEEDSNIPESVHVLNSSLRVIGIEK